MKKLLYVSLVFILVLSGCGKKDVSDAAPTGLARSHQPLYSLPKTPYAFRAAS